eukprot:5956565-Amphidinium_carterae.1
MHAQQSSIEAAGPWTRRQGAVAPCNLKAAAHNARSRSSYEANWCTQTCSQELNTLVWKALAGSTEPNSGNTL